jgi:hypothetical protein
MAVMSKHLQEELLKWVFNGQYGHDHTHAYSILRDDYGRISGIKKTPQKWRGDDILDTKLGPAEAVAVGAAAVLAKNPSISRRFWGRK